MTAWLTALAATAAIGVLLGMRFRVPAMLTASAVLFVACAIAGLFLSNTLWASVALAFAPLVSMQLGYLAGLAISVCLPFVKTRSKS